MDVAHRALAHRRERVVVDELDGGAGRENAADARAHLDNLVVAPRREAVGAQEDAPPIGDAIERLPELRFKGVFDLIEGLRREVGA